MSIEPIHTSPLTITLPITLPPLGDPSHPLSITVVEAVTRGQALRATLRVLKDGDVLVDEVMIANLDRRDTLARQIVGRFGASRGDVDEALIQAFKVAHRVEEQRASERRPRLRAVHPGDVETEPLTLVHAVLPDAPVAAEAVVPPGWHIDTDGTNRVTTGDDALTLPFHLVIARRHHDLATGRARVTLHWRFGDAQWHTLTVGNEQIADTRQIVQLSEVNFPVTSIIARAIVQYCADYLAANHAHIPVDRSTSSCGWKDHESAFMLGTRMIGGDPDHPITLVPATPEMHGYLGAIRASGEFATWRELVIDLTCQPTLVMALAAATAAPLLPILRCPTFLVDLCGESSSGKTTTLALCASLFGWGDALGGDGLIRGWNTTQVFVGRYAAFAAHLPMLLDESHLADPRQLGRVVYMLASGRDKGRGSLSGLRETGTWHTVVLTTGEQPLIGADERQGLRARVIEQWGSPFGGSAAPIVNRVRMVVDAHYGHAGERLIQFLVAHRDVWDAWRQQYEEARRWYGQASAFQSGVGNRYAMYAAAMETALTVAFAAWEMPEETLPTIRESIVSTVGKAMEGIVADGEFGQRALNLVLGWARANQSCFYVPKQERRERIAASDELGQRDLYGVWDGIGDLSVYAHKLRPFLTSFGFDYHGVLQAWRSKGWLRTNGNHLDYPRRIGNSAPTRMPTITAQVIAESFWVLADEERDDERLGQLLAEA